MNTHRGSLTGFEERLLTELKALIPVEASQEFPTSAASAPNRPIRFGWKPRLLTIGGLAALAVGLALGLPIVGDGAAAYAVTQNANGTVTVEINALRDAEGLEQKLHEAGIPALVQYLPPGKACKEDNLGQPNMGQRVPGRAMADPEPALVDNVVEMRTDGTIRFTVDKSRVQDGERLVIRTQEFAQGERMTGRTSGAPEGATAVSVGFYERQVQACEVVDSSP
jgi:hypothetical protein